MKKIAIILFLIATTLLVTACENKEQSYNNIIDEKSSLITSEGENSLEQEVSSNVKKKHIKSLNTIEIPISTISNDLSITKYIEVNEDSSIQEKMQIIVDAVSQEAFNNLPMNVKVYSKKNIAKINLIEHESSNKSRVTWKNDYLNQDTKEYTINTIIKNILQEEYKGEWIEKVQLYYDGKLIEID
ncbi:MAG: hypothetical protein ACRC3Y_19340 [Romboutsia sp.]|uniref:hypothetical protein n=1 Tax=Romboutsia sp. TaxID=1965302 RepID=UPI003F2E03DD